MEQSKTLVNYETAAKALAEFQQSNYWNPKEGKFEVVALSELVTYQEADKKDGTLKQKAKIDIEVINPISAKGRFVWTMGVGQTKASLYGQLVGLATSSNMKLTEKKFTVVIKNDGKKRDFTIV